jgi:hypothetical protein
MLSDGTAGFEEQTVEHKALRKIPRQQQRGGFNAALYRAYFTTDWWSVLLWILPFESFLSVYYHFTDAEKLGHHGMVRILTRWKKQAFRRVTGSPNRWVRQPERAIPLWQSGKDPQDKAASPLMNIMAKK